MRRVAAVVVLALVSSSIACGGLLGFGDDDDVPASPSGDGGADVVTAEGGSLAPEQCETRTLALGTDAGVAGPDWSAGITTSTGGASLASEDGKLVSRSGGGSPGLRAEATVFATREGNLSRVHCDVRVSSSSFTDDGRLFQLRVEGPQWQGFYDARVDWADGVFRIAYQAVPADGSAEKSLFQPLVPAPTRDDIHDLSVDLDFRATPRFAVSIAGATFDTPPPAPGPMTRTQVVIGTVADPPFEPHEVRYESVVCEMCIRP